MGGASISDGGEGTRSPVKIFGNIFISFIGAGVLGLPYAFKEAGVLEGSLILIIVGFLSFRGMMLLIKSKQFCSKTNISRMELSPPGAREEDQVELLERSRDSAGQEVNYGDLCQIAFGDRGKNIVDWAIIISQVGFCCAYLIFISENLAHYYHGLEEGDVVDDTLKLPFLLLMIPGLISLSLVRKLHKLSIFSLFADFANVFAYLVVFWFDFEHVSTISIHPKEMDLNGLPFFIGVSIYCYEGAGMILSLEASVAKDYRSRFSTIFALSITAMSSLYILFGVCGYLSFGPETHSIITLNLPVGPMPLMVKGCLCFSLFFTYPIMLFPVIEILERRLGTVNHFWKGNLLRASVVISSIIVVLIIPDFSTIMVLIGATCCSLLAFILPSLLHMRIFKGRHTRKQLIEDYAILLFGCLGTLIGSIDALKRLGIIPDYSGRERIDA